MILAGDIGGTNTRLALFNPDLQIEKKYQSKEYKGLSEIVWEFLDFGKIKVTRACFGVAGPVLDGVCKATNLPWIVDGKEIAKEIGIENVSILNDLEANAYGLDQLKPSELFLLNQGVEQKGNRALISAGTGLGEAGLFWDGKKHYPFACEGGHTDFGPRNDEEIELWKFLKLKFGHVSYERVVSGPGLHSIYEFLMEEGKIEADPEVLEAKDPSIVITKLAKEKNRGCNEAVDRFLSIYGAEAGNVALKFLSLGGLYIGGGIAPRLLSKIKEGMFFESFCDKGRFRGLLASIPIYIVLNDNAALLGAAAFAKGLH